MLRIVRRIALPGCILLAVFYIFWIPYLAVTLPVHYQVAHWTAAWVCLDALEFGLIVLTGWFLWRKSRNYVVTSAMLAGVMLSDALFDNLMSRGSEAAEARLGLIPELGIAALSTVLAMTYRDNV
jgi:hypothetical protein